MKKIAVFLSFIICTMLAPACAFAADDFASAASPRGLIVKTTQPTNPATLDDTIIRFKSAPMENSIGINATRSQTSGDYYQNTGGTSLHDYENMWTGNVAENSSPVRAFSATPEKAVSDPTPAIKKISSADTQAHIPATTAESAMADTSSAHTNTANSKGSTQNDSWSLINFFIMASVLGITAALVFSCSRQPKRQRVFLSRYAITSSVSILASLSVAILFFMTGDMGLAMKITDPFTPVMALILALQICLVVIAMRRDEETDLPFQ